MSHGKERAEKICLNCNSSVYGRYCHVCGQENIEPRETFWGLVTHFFNDITHFDGKFFTTVRHLVKKPGHLPLMYVKGQRSKYLHPVRMYVFTSAFFFFIFFWFYNAKSLDIGNNLNANADSTAVKLQEQQVMIDSLPEGTRRIVEKSLADLEKSRKKDSANKKVNSLEEYQKEQNALPEAERDGWMLRKLKERNFQFVGEYLKDPKNTLAVITDKFLHTFPYILFISLPLFAIFLKLLYSGKFYFIDHIMFLIYLYIFTFHTFLVMILFNQLKNLTQLGIFSWLNFILALAGIYYTLKAMRKFYRQDRTTTFFKFILFNIMCSILIFFLFIIFLLISLFSV